MSFTRPENVPADRVVDFDINMPPGIEEGFHECWYKLIETSPHKIMWTDQNGGHWIVTDGALLHDFFDQPERLSNEILFVPREIAENHHLIPTSLDPPEHTPYRKMLNTVLSPRIVRQTRAAIQSVSSELISKFAHKGQCDFIAEYSSIFPIRIFMSLVDLPEKDAAMLKRWCDAMVRPEPDLSYNEATELLTQYLHPVVQERREKSGDDLLSQLMLGEVDGSIISEENALKLAIQVMIAGLDTVVNILGHMWYYLALHPEIQTQISDMNQRARVVEELIRRFPIVSIARLATEDIDVDGVTIRADDVVSMPTMAHGLDSAANACPMDLDFNRKQRNHSSFGNGPHRCPGANLARSEILVTLDEWFDHIPSFRYDGEGTPTMQGGIVGTVESLPLRWD